MNSADHWPDKADQKRILEWVRRVAQSHLERAISPEPPAFCPPAVFGGAFVTFWSQGRLRGCIGCFEEITKLAEALRSVTISTLADKRFEDCPITRSELDALAIEVSLLSSPIPTSNPHSIEIGTHGIIVRSQGRSGCFLPKVALERGWSAEEFLSNCCAMKAGLRPDAWRDASTTFHTFTATVFSENEPHSRLARGTPDERDLR